VERLSWLQPLLNGNADLIPALGLVDDLHDRQHHRRLSISTPTTIASAAAHDDVVQRDLAEREMWFALG
jgi:hypothetical protein